MKTFTDNAGRTWTVAINVSAIKRVRALVNVDLLALADGTLLEQLLRDPVVLCDVLYAVCRPEAEQQDVGDEEFGRAMAGDAIDHATKALLEELVDFSPSPQDRANLQRILQATWRAMDRAREVVAKRLDGGELERAVARALATAGDSSGSAPASSVSTPAP